MFQHHLKPLEVALLAGVAVFLLSGAVSLQTQATLADKVVRLHVLANSDTPEDQALKLKVRDAVLHRAEALLRDTENRADAEALLRENLDAMALAARRVLAENGSGQSVHVELRDTVFPTRDYEGFSLPAGNYLALRVILGRGEGHNWWCVVFPPLCAAAELGPEAMAASAGLSGREIRLITGESEGYVLKFKVVEWWESIAARLEE